MNKMVMILAMSARNYYNRRRDCRNVWGHVPHLFTCSVSPGEPLCLDDDVANFVGGVEPFYSYIKPIHDGLAYMKGAYDPHCVLLCDDDTSINANNLYAYLRNWSIDELNYVGNVITWNGSPVEGLCHKVVPLDYTSGGGGTLLSRRAVDVLIAADGNVRGWSDVWVGEVLHGAGILPVNSTWFNGFRHTQDNKHAHESDDMVCTHPWRPSEDPGGQA